MRGIHHRTPAILPPENHGAWLDPGPGEKDALEDLLGQNPSEETEAYSVGRGVNRPQNDEPGVVEPTA